MPEFDFKTISVIISAVLGPGAILTFKEIFEKPAQPAARILKAFRAPVPPGRSWVENRRTEVIQSLRSIPRLLLSFFFFSVTMSIAVLVAIGPERILDPSRWGSLAEPLTRGEKVIYSLLLVPTVAVYIWKVSLPVWKGWKAVIAARRWLRNKVD
jgi:hypothetical protein